MDKEALVPMLSLIRIVRGYFWLMPHLVEGCNQVVTVNELIGCCWRHLQSAFEATDEELAQWLDMGTRLE